MVPWRVTCVTANNELPRSIVFLSLHTQRTLTFITSLPRLSDADDRVEGDLAIKLIIGLDFAVTLSSPDSTCEISLVKMFASWFLKSIYLIWIFGSKLIRPNNQSSATLWVLETCMSHCGTSSLCNHLDHCFVVFKHIQQSFLTRKLDV